jgi:hypothetical protein
VVQWSDKWLYPLNKLTIVTKTHSVVSGPASLALTRSLDNIRMDKKYHVCIKPQTK